MTHLVVARVSIALTLLALGAAALFAALVGPRAPPRVVAAPSVAQPSVAAPPVAASDDAHSGAALFERHCGGCHSLEDAVALTRRRTSPSGDAAGLRDFLRRHGKADDAQDARIVDYLRAPRTDGSGAAAP